MLLRHITFALRLASFTIKASYQPKYRLALSLSQTSMLRTTAQSLVRAVARSTCSSSEGLSRAVGVGFVNYNSDDSQLRRYCAAPESSTQSIGNEKVQKLADEILGLTILESSWLTEILRKKLNLQKPAFGAMPAFPMGAVGGSAPAAAAAAPAVGDAAPAAEKKEKTEFDVKLESFTADGKIKVIKEIRTITSLGLKEAKELVEKAPVVIKGNVAKADAENFKKLIEAAGGKVNLV